MNEERKQELTQLLQEAMGSLIIRTFGGDGSLVIPTVPYRKYLQKRWRSYGVDSSSVLLYLRPYIVNRTTKSRLLEFIREGLVPFIREDEIRSVSYAIDDDAADGFRLYDLRSSLLHLEVLLEHLLNIAIAYGIEEAVLAFDRCGCPQGTNGFFQDIASLEGIRLETKIQVFDEVRLAPFPRPTTFEIESHLPGLSMSRFGLSADPFMGKTLLIIDRPMLSVFHNPSEETFDGVRISDLPFQVETHGIKFPNSDAINSFRKTFCQALSLVCNSAVQIARTWWSLSEDELFRPFPGGGMGRSRGPFWAFH